MRIFKEAVSELSGFMELKGALEKGVTPVSVTGVSGIHKAQIILALADYESPVLVIAEDEQTARRLCSDIDAMAGGEICAFYPAKDFNFSRIESVSREYEHQRIEALSKIMNKTVSVMITNAEAASQKTIPPIILSQRSILIKTGGEYVMSELASQLVMSGYSRAEQVEGQSQFSIRGAILDIFPIGFSQPVRIEFWGDEADSISLFDPETQRRTEKLDEVSAAPALEVLFSSNEHFADNISAVSEKIKGKKAEQIKAFLNEDIELLKGGAIISNLDKYISVAYDNPATVFDYFKGGKVCICEYRNTAEKFRGFLSQMNEDIKIFFEEGNLFKGLDSFTLDFAGLFSEAEKLPCFFLDTFMRGGTDVKFRKLISINALQTSPWGGDISQLCEDLTAFCERDYSTVVMAGSEKTLQILINDLLESGIRAQAASESTELISGRVLVMPGCVSGGYEYPDAKQALITQAKAFVSKKKIKKRKKGEEIKSISDINEGDLVVHSLYGIGRFAGISKIETQGVKKDYITVKYAGSDVLYVPVTQLDLVSRYIGPRDDTGVKLNKLNSTDWQKTRSKVRSAVKDMAEELIKLYAIREASKGHAFPADNDWQADFEERFEYNETDDQLRSIEEIKQDMMRTVPMDRLLCGDVGFGKTEVALRAAFKCMLDEKQCAILCPTTVLAWQHYQTATKRFEHFPIKVELLSRFRTGKQQQEILRQLKRGEIDLTIGTH
ncbi:MAG: CarD family transcriptional regulator, partial [Oscillospiraceae bacterium]